MPVFRKAKLSLFRDDRARAIEEFAEQAMSFLSKDYPSDKCFGDIILEDDIEWQVLGNQKAWFSENNPLKNNGGNLDFFAACLDEGISIKKIWNQIGAHNYKSIVGETAMHGLHGIHFRMDVSSESDRMAYTCRLANEFFNDAAQNQYLSRLSILSTATHDMDVPTIGFLVSPPWGGNCQHLTVDQAVLLSSLNYCGETREEEDALFRQAVSSYLRVDSLERVSDRVAVIENAMVPLVYNFGYKLKAQGVDTKTVLHEAARRIDVLLSHLEMTQEFRVGLERQILINLFSAFPDGLEILKAQPEELQGVMLNQALISDPLAGLFGHTLEGPLALFSHTTMSSERLQANKLLDYLASAGYSLNLDTAIQGRLAEKYPLVHLAHRQEGLSKELERKLEEEGLDGVHRNVGMFISEPNRLCHYSDLAVLKVIAGAIDSDVLLMSTMKSVPDRETRSPLMYTSVASILKDRPHLFEPVLDMLEARNMLTVGMFEWCGFSGREIKALGSRAPRGLKVMLLESGMGL